MFKIRSRRSSHKIAEYQDQEIGACRHPTKPKLDWIIFDLFSRTSPKISQPTSTQRPHQRLTPIRSTRPPHTLERRHRVPPQTTTPNTANATCAFANPQPQSWVRLPAESPLSCALPQTRACMVDEHMKSNGNMANGSCSAEKEAREDGSGRFPHQPMYAYPTTNPRGRARAGSGEGMDMEMLTLEIQLSDHGPTKWTRSRFPRPRPMPTACAIAAVTANVAASTNLRGSLHAPEPELWEEEHRLEWEEVTASVGSPEFMRDSLLGTRALQTNILQTVHVTTARRFHFQPSHRTPPILATLTTMSHPLTLRNSLPNAPLLPLGSWRIRSIASPKASATSSSVRPRVCKRL